jgi:hypothetical protein
MALGPVFSFCTPSLVFGGTGGRRVPFSYFALPDSYFALPLPDSFWVVQRALGPVFLFCEPELVFSGSEIVGYRGCRVPFLVLSSLTRFRRYRGCRSRFHVLRTRNSFGGIEGVCFRFHDLRSRTHFWPFRGHRVPFLCLVLLNSFSAVPRASGPVFMFYAPGLIFGGTEGVRSRFHVLRPQTHYRRYRGRRLPFSRFAHPNSFSAVPRASGPVFLFCDPGLFSAYRGRRVPFSCFARSDSFLAVSRVSCPVSCFELPDTFLAILRASGPVFIFCAPGLDFGGTKGVGSLFHVLRS